MKAGDRGFMGTASQMVSYSVIGNDVIICVGSTVMANVRDVLKVIGKAV